MGKIAIHGRTISDESAPYIKKILSILDRHQVQVHISPDLATTNPGQVSFTGFPVYEPNVDMGQFDAILSLGGDGTLLQTLTHVGRSELPILGINLGRLGFLANISKDSIDEALESYFNHEYDFDDRTLIRLVSDYDIFKGHNYALNEFSILRKDTSSMIVVKCFLDGEYLNTYWADGLMVATPTGSTGYSLSCGGPVIMPQTSNFIISPVSPHNLNVRPLVVSENSEIRFVVESPNQSFLVALDSRSETIDNKFSLSVSKADFKARLIRIKGVTFLDTLRNKLAWGLDRRN